MKWASQILEYEFGCQASRLIAFTQSALRSRSSGNLNNFTLFKLLQRLEQPMAQQLDGMFLPYKMADTTFYVIFILRNI